MRRKNREAIFPIQLPISNYPISIIVSGEEGEDDARSACPFDILGCTHNTMAPTTRSDEATLS